MAVLDRLGVLDTLHAAGAVSLDQLTLQVEDARIEADLSVLVAEGRLATTGLCVRRVTLDAVLVEAAARAGAEVQTGTKVTSLLVERDRVAGVQTDRGPIRAALVVGADGRSSTVAEQVGAQEYHVAAPGRTPSWAYFEGVANPERRLRLARRGDLALLGSPTDAGLYLAGVSPSYTEKGALLADRERAFAAGVHSWPELADLLAGARRVGPIRVVQDWHGYLREAAGPGWVLLGAGRFDGPRRAARAVVALARRGRVRHALVRDRHGSRGQDRPAGRPGDA